MNTNSLFKAIDERYIKIRLYIVPGFGFVGAGGISSDIYVGSKVNL